MDALRRPGNGGYKIALYGSVGYDVEGQIGSTIEGSGNTISGPHPSNGKADYSPEERAFVETEAGGTYGEP